MFGQADRVLELSRFTAHSNTTGDSKTFVFTSGKGGTGKTFLSVNLAHAISKHYKVLFIDLDQNLSNANIMFNEIPEKTIFDFFAGKNLLEETIKEYDENLHFIFGDSGRLNYPRVKNEAIVYFFNQLKKIQSRYDYTIIDSGSGANEEILAVLTRADVNVIVTTPEPTAVMDAYVMLKLLNSHNYKGKKTILVNKCGSEEEGKTAFTNLTSAAGHFLHEKLNLLGTICFDAAVGEAIMAQQPILIKSPLSSATLQIVNVSESLYEFAHMANIQHS
jgi:flagellar biosynthesis protein FlhG